MSDLDSNSLSDRTLSNIFKIDYSEHLQIYPIEEIIQSLQDLCSLDLNLEDGGRCCLGRLVALDINRGYCTSYKQRYGSEAAIRILIIPRHFDLLFLTLIQNLECLLTSRYQLRDEYFLIFNF